MSEQLSTALSLLGVGMITVFIVLFLVIFIGTCIIAFVNRYMPEEAKKGNVSKTTVAPAVIDSNKMAAIASAVQIVTQGKGTVTNVEKI